MSMRKILALLLAVVMICSLFVSPALAAEDEGIVAISDTAAPEFTDLADHWAEGAILRWAEEGIVQGYGDGTVQPAGNLKRAELATILARLLGLKAKADANTFSDVAADAWYADAVLKCAEAGIMLGDGTGRANPEATIDRQQTIVMVGRALGVKPATGHSLDRFDDGDTVADWAAPYMIALTDKGILSGLPTGEGDGAIVAPTVNIDRASTFTLLDKAIAQYITAPCTVTVSDADKFVVINSAAEEKGVVTVTGSTAGVVIAVGTTDDVVLNRASVGTLKVDAPVDVTINRGSAVTDLDANAAADVTNNGTVGNLNTNADDVIFDGNKPAKVNTAEGVEPAKDSKGKEVTEQPASSGSSSGGSNNNRPPVQSADVVAAPLEDHAATNAIPVANLGKVTITSAVKGDKEYDVKITARDVMNHTNAATPAADGHWVGFGMPAKTVAEGEAASSYTYEVDGQVVASIAERTYTAPNGKVYNTVYFSNETEEEYEPCTIVVKDGETVVATYNVTFEVTFYKVAAANVKVLATEADTAKAIEALEKDGTPWAHKFAKGLGLTAAVSANKVTLTDETTLTALQVTSATPEAQGVDGYLTYVLQVTDENIKGFKFNNDVAAPDALELDGITLVMNQKIYDGANKSFATAATATFVLTDAAGREQDSVTVTVDASAVTIEGMSTAIFKDHDGTVLATKACAANESITTPAAPTREGYYFVGWKVQDGETTETLKDAEAQVQITGNTTFTAEYKQITDQATTTRPAGDPNGFDYPGNYTNLGLSLVNNVITVNTKTLIGATVPTEVKQTVEGKDYVFYGVEYTKPADATHAVVSYGKTLTAFDDSVKIALDADSDGGTSVYSGHLIDYIPVAYQANDVWGFYKDGAAFTRYIKWLKNDEVLSVTKATMSLTTTPAQFNVTFKDGDKTVETVKVNYNTAIGEALPKLPAKVGYTGKWMVDETEITAESKFSADTEVTADWSVNAQELQTRPNGPAAVKNDPNYDYGALYTAAGVTLGAKAEDGSYTYTINADTFAAYAAQAENDLNVLAAEVDGKTYYFYGVAIMAPEGATKLILTDDNDPASLDDAEKCSEFPLDSTNPHFFTIEGKKCVLHYFGAVAVKNAEGDYEFQADATFTRFAKWVDAEGNEVALNVLALKRVTTAPTAPEQGGETHAAELSSVEVEEVAAPAEFIVPRDDEVAEIPVMD